MQISRFEADDVQTAMAQVKAELGEGAVVLQTRHLKRRGLLGFGGRDRVELVVAVDRPTTGEGPQAGRSGRFSRNSGVLLKEEVQALRRELAELRGHLQMGGEADLSARLESAGIQPAVSELLLQNLPPEADSQAVARALAAMIPCEPVDLSEREHTVIAVVGPTGVGKTTTVAKLAANARLTERKRVGLITVDTYRIGAVDQIRTYSRLIDVPMEVVLSPAEMRDACHKLADCELIVVDTVGRNQMNEKQINEQAMTLAAAEPTDVLLAISATSSYAVLGSVLDGFASVQPTRLLLTKLDEAVKLGEAVSFLAEAELPLAYTTHGQEVPHDIAPGDAYDLACQALGVER